MYNPFNLTRDDILARMGLQARRSTASTVMLSLGVLGVGLVAGAGLGMLFAPRTGRETREQLGHRASELAGKVRTKVRRAGRQVEEGLEDARDAVMAGFDEAIDRSGGNGVRAPHLSHS